MLALAGTGAFDAGGIDLDPASTTGGSANAGIGSDDRLRIFSRGLSKRDATGGSVFDFSNVRLLEEAEFCLEKVPGVFAV